MDDPASPQYSDLASDLCTACALCCTGAIFNTVGVEFDELQSTVMLGIAVKSARDGNLSFWQPCPQLAGKCCQVYAGRPQGCRQYRCELLKRLDSGDVAYADALGLVEVACKRAEAANGALEGETIPQFRLRRAEALDRAEALPPSPALEAIHALDEVLDKHFRRPLQRQSDKFAAVERRTGPAGR
jgi:uncharacterized protein